MTASSLPRPSVEPALEVISGLGLLANVAIIASAWSSLPERVPKHFGGSGLPDAYGAKSNVLAPLLLALFLYVLFTAVQRLSPRFYKSPVHITPDKAAALHYIGLLTVASIKTLMCVFLAGASWLTVQVALGHRDGLGSWFLPGVLLIPLLPVLWFAAAAKYPRKA